MLQYNEIGVRPHKGGVLIAREKRNWYPGEVLHVMNRGANHQEVFLDEPDYHFFIKLIRETQEKYHYIVHAYCLMKNHYHLLIETENQSISTIMKIIDQKYTRYFNGKYHRDGALFRGRFKSCEVLDGIYFLQLSRYISLNPVKAGMVTAPHQYKWSSYRTYIGMNADSVTNCDRTLSYFYNNSRERYSEFVESSITENNLENEIREDIGEDAD